MVVGEEEDEGEEGATGRGGFSNPSASLQHDRILSPRATTASSRREGGSPRLDDDNTMMHSATAKSQWG